MWHRRCTRQSGSDRSRARAPQRGRTEADPRPQEPLVEGVLFLFDVAGRALLAQQAEMETLRRQVETLTRQVETLSGQAQSDPSAPR